MAIDAGASAADGKLRHEFQAVADATNKGARCTAQWFAVPGGPTGGNTTVRALASFDDGSGLALYAGGSFGINTGLGEALRVAKWNGHVWNPLGSGVDSNVDTLAVFDDGTGPALYAGGQFRNAGSVPVDRIAKWDGSSWSPLGSGLNGRVLSLAVFDDGSGPALYACGEFFLAGGTQANRIAKWDGATWSPLGSGLSGSPNSLVVFDDGTGPALYAAGEFFTAGGLSVNRIAKWDGVSWSSLGEGLTGSTVRDLEVFDDGNGPALYAGGAFVTAGGQPANRVAKWDGVSWSPLGAGLAGGTGPGAEALKVFDDGSGLALYVAGQFTSAGGVAASRIARWDGSAWSALDSGLSARALELATFDDGNGPALFVGGQFTSADGIPSNRIAKWQGCPATSTSCPGDTNGDGVINFTDLNAVLTQFGQSVAPGSGGDVTGDGVVNFSDLNEVLSNFGNACN